MPSWIITPVEIVLRTIFVAVPAFSREIVVETGLGDVTLTGIERVEEIALRRYSTGQGKDQAVIMVHTEISELVDQLEAGAIGITCAKVGEAEVMAQAGVRAYLYFSFREPSTRKPSGMGERTVTRRWPTGPISSR